MLQANKVIVIGGGPAGLMAAGTAAESGAQVILLEKMKSPGRKLCISGKGRCNLTNIADLNEFINHFGKQGRFLHQAFSHFFSTELIDFFKQHQLELHVERGGRVFPARGKATDVFNVLMRWLNANKVTIQTSSSAERLLLHNNKIRGVRTAKQTMQCDAVIVATGGASYPATGSTGDGYGLVQSVGHTITSIRPALVPLLTGGLNTQGLDGLNLRNVKVRLFVNGKRKKQYFGEMGFTRYGVTGPVILSMSGYCVDCLNLSKTIRLSIDLKPALDDKKLDNRLLRDLQNRGKEPIHSILRGLLPKQLVPFCLNSTGLNPDQAGHSVSADQRRRLRLWLKDFQFDITGYRPLNEAIVTAGGVQTNEINPRTMESQLIQGLYIVGELLDIHGDTGGYNLQAAFSTGRLAGLSAANHQNLIQ